MLCVRGSGTEQIHLMAPWLAPITRGTARDTGPTDVADPGLGEDDSAHSRAGRPGRDPSVRRPCTELPRQCVEYHQAEGPRSPRSRPRAIQSPEACVARRAFPLRFAVVRRELAMPHFRTRRRNATSRRPPRTEGRGCLPADNGGRRGVKAAASAVSSVICPCRTGHDTRAAGSLLTARQSASVVPAAPAASGVRGRGAEPRIGGAGSRAESRMGGAGSGSGGRGAGGHSALAAAGGSRIARHRGPAAGVVQGPVGVGQRHGVALQHPTRDGPPSAPARRVPPRYRA